MLQILKKKKKKKLHYVKFFLLLKTVYSSIMPCVNKYNIQVGNFVT